MIKLVTNLLTSLIFAVWIGAIAIVSIQNITPVSLKFLSARSIELPIGLVLAFSVGVGAIAAALVPVLWRFAGQPPARYQEEDFE